MAELKSNVEWKQWGKDDPLWGVASWAGKNKNGASPWTNEEFYALGESDWEDFLRHWQQYGVNTQSCLEIGCGAGRLTKQLSMFFDHVYAVDVSQDMIGRAQKAIANENVEFFLVDGLHLPQANGAVKAIFSTHVLQHLNSEEVGFAYFREFLRVLDVGGTLMVHLPLYQFPVGARKFAVLHAFHRFVSDIKASVKRRLGIKLMRMTFYPIGPLSAFLSELGFKRVEFRIFQLKSNGDHHPFVFASK